MDTTTPVIIVIILILLIAVIVVITLKRNNKLNNTKRSINTINNVNNKENFAELVGLNAEAELLNLDNLLNAFKSIDGITEMVASNSLEEGIKSIQSSISYMKSEIENLKKQNIIDNLPVGTIIMWNGEELPSNKWKWCNGSENNIPNLRYKFPLGGKSYRGEEGKPEGENDGLIKENNVPKHRHPLSSDKKEEKFPVLAHNHDGKTHDEDKTHIHTTDIPGGWNSSGAGSTSDNTAGFERNKIDAGYHVSKHSGSPSNKHKHGINTSLSREDNKIQVHIIGEGPIYGEGEEQKPFYPKYELVNFIIKVS